MINTTREGIYLTIYHIPKRCRKAQYKSFTSDTLEGAISKAKAFLLETGSKLQSADYQPCTFCDYGNGEIVQMEIFAKRTNIFHLFGGDI